MREITCDTPTHHRANQLLARAALDDLTFTAREAEEADWPSACPLLSAKTQNAFSHNSTYVRFAHPAHRETVGDAVPRSVYNLAVIETTDADPVAYVTEMFKNAVNAWERETGFTMGERDLKATAYEMARRFLSTIDAENAAADDYDASEITPTNYEKAKTDEKNGIDVRFDDGHTIQVKMNGAGKKDDDADERVNVEVPA